MILPEPAVYVDASWWGGVAGLGIAGALGEHSQAVRVHKSSEGERRVIAWALELVAEGGRHDLVVLSDHEDLARKYARAGHRVQHIPRSLNRDAHRIAQGRSAPRVTALAFDLCCGARGWEADADDLDLETVGFDVDTDACSTGRAAGLFTVQADIAILDPLAVAAIYGQPEGLIASPPCQLFSSAGSGAARRIMEELHRAVVDAAQGASDEVLARHRRELARLLHAHLRTTEGVGAPARYAGRKRHRTARFSTPARPLAESSPIRRGELRAEANRQARNASLVWQPARWASRLRPRWIALEQVPPVLPLWRSMARALERDGYRCWTGILSAERYGTVATCPVHAPQPAPSASGRLSLTALATVDPAETEWVAWLENAENAGRLSTYSTAAASVDRVGIGRAITSEATAARSAAWAVASLARGALDAAVDAIWRERVNDLLSRALPARQTPRGRAGEWWERVATCGSATTGDIAPNIGWSPSDFWGALCSEARSFTTSMKTALTTPMPTSGSSLRIAPTCSITGTETSPGACSLCDNRAVPQTRRRAILLASLDGQPQPPAATHQAYVPGEPARAGEPDLFGPGLEPWVSMAEALGWGMTARPTHTITAGGTGSGGGVEVFASSDVRDVMKRERDEGRWRDVDPDDLEVDVTRGAGMVERHGERRGRRGSEPAPTTRSGEAVPARRRAIDEPAPTVASQSRNDSWVTDRPATTVAGDPRVFPPGHKVNGDDLTSGRGGQRPIGAGHTDGTDRGGAVRVSVHEAAILQSFPADWPWVGTQSSIFGQIGNAVPPGLARHVLVAAMLPTRHTHAPQPRRTT